MRWFRKITSHCQNCIFGNNEKGKNIKTWKRNPCKIYAQLSKEEKREIKEKGYWHIFCERKEKYFPWDTYKRCFQEANRTRPCKECINFEGKDPEIGDYTCFLTGESVNPIHIKKCFNQIRETPASRTPHHDQKKSNKKKS